MRIRIVLRVLCRAKAHFAEVSRFSPGYQRVKRSFVTEFTKMMLLNRQSLRLILVLSVTSALFFSTLVTPPARGQSKLPRPTTHVNDNAGAISEPAKQQLENILGNLQARSGINFTVVTVKTTGGRDIYDFSHQLAGDWDIGARTSPSKSLLLVVSVEEKIFFTQFSKQVANQLPEGALGEVSQRLRGRISSGRIAEALLDGIRQFVTELGGKIGFSTDGIDQPPPPQTAAAVHACCSSPRWHAAATYH